MQSAPRGQHVPKVSYIQSMNLLPMAILPRSHTCLHSCECQCLGCLLGARVLAVLSTDKLALAGLALQQAFSQMLLHLTLMTLL